MNQIPRRYRYTAYAGVSALVAAAVLFSINRDARGIYEVPSPIDEIRTALHTDTAPIHFAPVHHRANVSVDSFHGTYFYASYAYFLGHSHKTATANFDLAVPDLPLANLQGIAPVSSALDGLNQPLENFRPLQGAAERLKPVEASVGGVQLRMLGAANPAANTLDTTLTNSSPVGSLPGVSGAGGLLRR